MRGLRPLYNMITELEMYVETCCNCGITFGFPKKLFSVLKENGASFYCPNGHSQHYTHRKSIEEKLREKEKEISRLNKRICLDTDKNIMWVVGWRYSNNLTKAGIQTIGDALKAGENGLRKVYGVGDVCINKVNNHLSKFNVKLN